MGADGHTASLFPGTKALSVHDRWCVANVVDNPISQRITLTFGILNAARVVMFLVVGASKATALRDVLTTRAQIDRLPSQGVKPENGKLIWLIDEAAASSLPPGMGQR